MAGHLWSRLNAVPRISATELTGGVIPQTPGVYAWYHKDKPIYAGRAVGAKGLRDRVWRDHMATGLDISRSSFRRNVCDHLGIANTSFTRARPTRLTQEDVEPVNMWI
jgi:protein-disulfide isomerase-like protein with CxxC motif